MQSIEPIFSCGHIFLPVVSKYIEHEEFSILNVRNLAALLFLSHCGSLSMGRMNPAASNEDTTHTLSH